MNIEKIKQKLEQYQASSTQSSKNIWKAPSGKSQIRLVEYKHNKETPFVELYFHFNLKKIPVLSPMSYGEPDPIVEFSNKLKKTGSKEDFLLARKLEPKLRIFAPIVVRGAENEGIKIWGFGKTVANELMGFIIDPDYGNIADTINGRDIVVTSITPAEAGNQYGNTKILVKPNKSALHTDAAMVQRLLEVQPVIPDLYTKNTYDELKEILKNYLEPSEEKKEEVKDAPVAVSTMKSKGSKVENVDTAFDDIFNN